MSSRSINIFMWDRRLLLRFILLTKTRIECYRGFANGDEAALDRLQPSSTPSTYTISAALAIPSMVDCYIPALAKATIKKTTTIIMALYHPPCGCTRALDNLRHVIVEQQQFPPVQFSDGGEKTLPNCNDQLRYFILTPWTRGWGDEGEVTHLTGRGE